MVVRFWMSAKLRVSEKMEFNFWHGRKRMKRMSEFENGKSLMPKPKPSFELPLDVIVSILIRLPARHLRRMRCVCRSWNLLISDRHFIREYSNYNQANVAEKPYIVSFYCDSRWLNDYSMKFVSQGDDYGYEFDLSGVLVGPCFSISNSCDGLICVVGPVDMYLVNPSIQKVRALPTGSWHKMAMVGDIPHVGLGFDDHTGEYKVVRIFHHTARHQRQGFTGCEVYTLGDFHAPAHWKVIEDAPLEPSESDLPVLVKGAIHWTATNDVWGEVPPEVAISFNIKSETFDVIWHPKGRSRPRYSIVLALGGHLCIADTDPDEVQMDIWFPKEECSNREWIKQYSIVLTEMYDYTPISCFSTRPVTIYDGKMVFCNDNGRRDFYDLKRKRFIKREYDVTDCQSDAAYTESIVWPGARVTI